MPTSEDFLDFFSHSQNILTYTDFSSSISRRVFNSDLHSNSQIFNKIVSPYSPNAFNNLLRQHNILHLYPSLVRNLLTGFPIGPMPEMASTTIIPNHPSCIPFMVEIFNYLTEEVQDGRMSGPLSRAEVESTLRGPFYSSPLLVSVQPQAPGTPDKIRMCKNLSKGTKTTASVNSHIPKASFPTRFDTASRVADMVSLPLSFVFSFPFSPYPLSSLGLLTILNTLYTIHNTSIHHTSIHNTLYTILHLQFSSTILRLLLRPQAPRRVPLILPSSIGLARFSRTTSLGLSFKAIQGNFTLNIAIPLGCQVQVAILG